jgi:two-component system chemotaxis response regulator CheY
MSSNEQRAIEERQLKLFANYMPSKAVLIADASGSYRATIANVLTNLGVKGTQIKLTDSYEEAEAALKAKPYHLVIADFTLGSRSGMDLLSKQRTGLRMGEKSIFILVTGNSAQSAVAQAAEEDVDNYILKPFSADVLRRYILRTVAMKVSPSEYIKSIENGKKELASQKFDEALKIFDHSKSLDKTPALACYYLARTQDFKQSLELAEAEYKVGLSYNSIHYKCLSGLYENLMLQKKHGEAYEIIKKMALCFPANPQRLSSVLRLAVMTQSFGDIETYYKIFTSFDDRNEEMIKYICASLVVCGKFFLKAENKARALEMFEKAAITSAGRTKILREVIQALAEFKLTEYAEVYMNRFPSASRTSTDYLAATLAISDSTDPKGIVVEKGRKLLADGHHDPLIYRILIRRLLEAGKKAEAEDLRKNAIEKFPEQKAAFEKLSEAQKS